MPLWLDPVIAACAVTPMHTGPHTTWSPGLARRSGHRIPFNVPRFVAFHYANESRNMAAVAYSDHGILMLERLSDFRHGGQLRRRDAAPFQDVSLLMKDDHSSSVSEVLDRTIEARRGEPCWSPRAVSRGPLDVAIPVVTLP